jgi:hypothetical protein
MLSLPPSAAPFSYTVPVPEQSHSRTQPISDVDHPSPAVGRFLTGFNGVAPRSRPNQVARVPRCRIGPGFQAVRLRIDLLHHCSFTI